MGRASRIWLTGVLTMSMLVSQLPAALTGMAIHAAASSVDQSNAINSGIGGYQFSNTAAAKVAQTVTAGVSGALDGVDVAVSCTSGAVLTIQIRAVDLSGVITEKVLTALAVNGPLPNDGAFKHFGFATPVSFAAGEQFAIVMIESSTAADVSCTTLHGPSGDPYAGGDGYYQDNLSGDLGAWRPLNTDVGLDWPFQTYVLQAATVGLSSYASTVTPGEYTTVSWSGSPSNGNAILLYPVGAADGTPATGYAAALDGVASGSRTFLIPQDAAPGQYELRLLADSATPIARSAAFTIGTAYTPSPLTAYALTAKPGSDYGGSQAYLELIDLATKRPRKLIDLGTVRLTALAVSPDGLRAYVSDLGGDGQVLVVNIGDASLTAPISVASPRDLALSSDGRALYVGSYGNLYAFSTETFALTATLPLTAPGGQVDVSLGLAMAPGGKYLATIGMCQSFCNDGVEDGPRLYVAAASTLGLAEKVPITNPGETTNCLTLPNDVVFATASLALLWDSNCDTLYQVDISSGGSQLTAKTVRMGRDTGSSFNYNNALSYSAFSQRAYVHKETDIAGVTNIAVMDPAAATGLLYDNFSGYPFLGALTPDGKDLYVAVIHPAYYSGTTLIPAAADSFDRLDTATNAFTRDVFSLEVAGGERTIDMKIISVAAPALTGVAQCGGTVLPGATVDLLSGTSVVATTIAGESGAYGFPTAAANASFGLRYTSADGTIVCGAEVSSGEGNTTVPDNTVPNLHNSTWLTAYLLQGDGTPVHDYIATPRDAWFKFSINPGEQVIVSLRDCEFDCSLVLFTDISQAAAANQSGTIAAVQQTQRAVAPAELSPAELSPAELSPAELSPAELSAALTTPAELSPAELSPAELSPAETTPAELSPAELSPAELSAAAYSSAQTASILAVSAHAGLSPELIVRNTWEHTGSFYARVLSHDGTTSQQPFTISARALPGACANVPLSPIPSSLLAGIGTASTSTLYLTNSSRLVDAPATATAPAMTVAQFMTRLHAFAALHGGTVVDFAGDTGVAAGQAILDAHTDCALAANTIADTINGVVQAYRANGGLQYIVIAGGDRAIPFRRVPDLSGLGTEDSYHVPVLDSSVSNAALKSRFFLSQDFYAAPFPIVRGNLRVYLPQEGIGRLVESPRDMTAMLDAFDLVNGMTAPKKALSTGYDFIADLADDLKATFATEGLTTDTLIEATGLKPTDPTAWTADQLRAKLFGNTTYDIYAVNGHFAGNLALAADYKTLVGSDEVANLPASDVRYRNALILSMGCHAGYSIVDQDGVPDLTQTVAWAEAWNGRGATVVGGTGYGYADTDFVQYSEKILSNTAKALGIGAGPVAIGEALVSAKAAYLSALAAPEGIDVKAASEATLYGLPMMRYDVLRPGAASGTTPLSLTSGTSAGLQYGTPVLSYALNPHTETGVPVSNSNATVDLTYYDASGDIQVTPLQPILPRNVTRLSVPGTTVLRGGALVSAQYTEVSPILPRTDVATIEERGQLPTAFASVYTPLRLFSINQIGDDPSLVVLPLQYLTDGVTGTARLYEAANLNIRLYASSRVDASALADAPSITSVVLTRTPTGVHVDALIGGLIAAGLEDVLFTYTTGADPTTHVGTWTSVTLRGGTLIADRRLETGAGYSEHVSGDITTASPDDVRLFVQAVSGNALVSVASNTGAYYRLEPDTTATPQAPKHHSALAFTSAPASSVTYGATVSATVRLSDGGVGVDGKAIDFYFGGHHVKAVTAGGGFASANFVASLSGGSLHLFTAAFLEDPTLMGNSIFTSVAIDWGQSNISSSAVTAQYSDGATLAATLTGGGVGLNSELVIATIKSGATVVGQRVTMTDGTGTARFDVRSFGEFAPGAYTATLAFDGNDVFGASSATVDFTRTVEDATIAVTQGPQPAGSVTVKATVAQAADGAPGDLRRAIASFTLQPETGAAIVRSAAVAADGTVSVTLPLTAGVYTVSATVGGGWFTSGPAATTVIMPVYDPTTFATGGGYALTSATTPAGKTALPLAKKGNFGFNVKYKDGTTTPTGSLLFQLKEASIDLKATGFEWLVINSGRAEFQGTATINGSAGYSFRVIATQGTSTVADRFEIRIWNAAGSFDAPTYVVSNTVGGGSLKVH